MFLPGKPNIFVPGDSLFKCIWNNISIEKKILKISDYIKMLNCLFVRDVLTKSTIPPPSSVQGRVAESKRPIETTRNILIQEIKGIKKSNL